MTDVPNHSAHSAGQRRRYLTILFSDLSDSTKLAGTMEAEDFAILLGELRRAYEDVIPKHGGTVVQIQGDGVLAIFGHPETQEDDGRRASEAAIELHHRVREIQVRPLSSTLSKLALHTGIHSGLALLDEGDAVRGRFQLLGSAPNIAARISDKAEADQILVSAETLGADRHFFATGPLHSLWLQGVADEVPVVQVFARSLIGTRLQARAQRGLASFVGRRQELDTLHRVYQQTMSGQPSIVSLAGAAGIGKTRLVESFFETVADDACQVHRGYCESYLSAEPLQPFLQMVRAICGIQHGVSAIEAAVLLKRTLQTIDEQLLVHFTVLSRALSLPVELSDETGSRPSETAVVAIRDLFNALASSRPILVFVDDWQWADDSSRQALDAIERLPRPILVLVATREVGGSHVLMRDAQALTLAPLSAEETGNTIRRLIPGIDPFIARDIEVASGGNPLFLEELCHSAAVSGGKSRIGTSHKGTAWLNTLIESRIARLSAEQIVVVRAAAVVGNVIPAWLLERITGFAADHPVVAALADHDVIFPGEIPETLRFKHGIARDIIYETVGLHQRRSLHVQIADLLKQQSVEGIADLHYELLAYHYAAGGDAASAAHYAELAGDKALAASSLDRAQAQYRAALVALDQVEPVASILQRWSLIAQRLGMACVFDPSRDSLALFHRGVTIAVSQSDPILIARAEYWLGYVYYALGDSREAIEHFEYALASATSVADAPFIAEIQATLGQASCAACKYDEALLLLESAINFKRLQRREGPAAAGLAYTLACKASVLGDRGAFGPAQECFDEALQLVRGSGHEVEGSILCWRSGVLLWQGRWDEARQAAAQAGEIAERVKSLYVYAMSVSLGAYSDWCARHDSQSVETLAIATSWLDKLDRELFISLNHGWLADAYAARAQWSKARQHAARALIRSRHHDRIGEAMAYRALARAAAVRQARHPVEHYLARAYASADARGSPHEHAITLLCSAEIDFSRNLRTSADAALARAESAFASMQMTAHMVAAAALRPKF